MCCVLAPKCAKSRSEDKYSEAPGFCFPEAGVRSNFPRWPWAVWTVGIGLVATVVAASYVSRLAKVCCFSFCLSGFGSVLFLKQEQRQNCCFLDWWLPVPPCLQFAIVFAQILKEHSLSCRMQLKRLSEDRMTNKSNQAKQQDLCNHFPSHNDRCSWRKPICVKDVLPCHWDQVCNFMYLCLRVCWCWLRECR